jgi:hypothetical protein
MQWGSGGKTQSILDLGTRWKSVPPPDTSPPSKDPRTHSIEGYVGPGAGVHARPPARNRTFVVRSAVSCYTDSYPVSPGPFLAGRGDLFCDAVSSLDCVPLGARTIDELERICKEVIVA